MDGPYREDNAASEALTSPSVSPAPEHRHRARHWVLVRSFFGWTWKLAAWDASRGTWRHGRREITPVQAAARGWDYTGPALSARDYVERRGEGGYGAGQ